MATRRVAGLAVDRACLRAWCFVVLSVLLFALGLALGQASTIGSISGQVKDATGAVIPGVEVNIINQDTGVRRVVLTNDSGFYTAPNVPVGNYSVNVSMPGFKAFTAENLKVDIRSNIVQNVTLEVGEVTELVTVESRSMAQVELRSAEVANLISEEQISELPMSGRSFVQLSLLVPGASIANGANVRSTGLLAGVDISFSGSPTNANMWLVDGTNNVDWGSGRTILTYPSVDSIAEFKIHRNMYGADMAASSGAQINVVTKSGTNEFHGTIYEFWRNTGLNSADYFLNLAGQPMQPLNYNNFGYTIGGPIVKDRAFFFWSQEWRIERRGVPRQNLVPTMLERQGDFSGPNSSYDDPTDPLTGEPFPGNQIPADRLSPAGLAMMKLYPVPTIDAGSATFADRGYNWIAAPSTPIDTRQELIRGDVVLNQQHSFMGRLTMDKWGNRSPSYIEGGLWGDDAFPAVDSDWEQPGISLTTQWTATFGPSTVNQASFSWSGNEIAIVRGAGDDINEAINAAIPEVFPGPAGHGHATLGDPLGNFLWHQAPWQNEQDLLVWKDDFSQVVGDHSLKLGVLVSRNAKDEDISNNSQAHAPNFWGPVAIPGGAGLGGGWGPPNALGNGGQVSGNGLADLLLKQAYWGGGSESNANPRCKARWRDYEVYFNDTWRANSRLTVNYGFRWSYLPNGFQDDDRIGNFILDFIDESQGAHSGQGMIYPGNTRGLDVDQRGLVKNHFFDIAPRVGVAWDPTGAGKWAVRGGVGIFYNREAISDLLMMTSNPPFRTWIGYGNGRPLDWLPDDSEYSGGEGLPQIGKAIENDTPGSYQWNLTIERELWRDTKVEFGYVANRGHHLPGATFFNQVPAELRKHYGIWELDTGPGSEDTDGDVLRPLYWLFGDGAGPQVASRGFDSWYHSFQAYFVKRFSNRLSHQVSYTFSKTLATAYGLGYFTSTQPSDNENSEYDKALADVDRRHIFSANLIYLTPELKGRTPFIRGVFGNWETAAIVTLNSGVPWTVECCANFTGTLSNRPDLVGDPNDGPKTVDQWFNTDAFRLQDYVGVLGNSPRGSIRSPGISNLDISVMKNFPGLPWFTSEGAKLQFRAEFFNALNQTQFSGVDLGYDIQHVVIDNESGQILEYDQTNTNFGRVVGMRQPREIQIALKIIW